MPSSLTFHFTCADVNECDAAVCDQDTEVCLNLEGSHTCNCRDGLLRQKGKCVPKIRKSKKKKGNFEEGGEDIPTIRDDYRYLYPVVGSFLLLLGVLKYAHPDILVSLVLVIFVAVALKTVYFR